MKQDTKRWCLCHWCCSRPSKSGIRNWVCIWNKEGTRINCSSQGQTKPYKNTMECISVSHHPCLNEEHGPHCNFYFSETVWSPNTGSEELIEEGYWEPEMPEPTSFSVTAERQQQINNYHLTWGYLWNEHSMNWPVEGLLLSFQIVLE